MNEQLQFVDTDGLCNGLVSVRLSVCPIDQPQHWQQWRAAGLLLGTQWAGDIDRQRRR